MRRRAQGAGNITVTPVGDSPRVASISTNKDTQSDPIVIDRNANDGAEVSHFRISAVANGVLFQADGITPVADGSFITYAQAQAGLRFSPSSGSLDSGTFLVEASEDGATVAAQSAMVMSTISITDTVSPDDSSSAPSGHQTETEAATHSPSDKSTESETTKKSPAKSAPQARSDLMAALLPSSSAQPTPLIHSPLNSELDTTQFRFDQLIETIKKRSQTSSEQLTPDKLTLDALNSLWRIASNPMPTLNGDTEDDAQSTRSSLDSLREKIGREFDALEEELADNERQDQLVLGAEVIVSASFSAGYVAWLLRGGMLLSSVLSSIPMWRLIDPLPVFAFMDRRGSADNEGDSLDALIERGEQQAASRRAIAQEHERDMTTQQE